MSMETIARLHILLRSTIRNYAIILIFLTGSVEGISKGYPNCYA